MDRARYTKFRTLPDKQPMLCHARRENCPLKIGNCPLYSRNRLTMLPPELLASLAAVHVPHRLHMLPDILERRFKQAGVGLRHGTEIDDPSPRRAASDVHAVQQRPHHLGIPAAIRFRHALPTNPQRPRPPRPRPGAQARPSARQSTPSTRAPLHRPRSRVRPTMPRICGRAR